MTKVFIVARIYLSFNHSVLLRINDLLSSQFKRFLLPAPGTPEFLLQGKREEDYAEGTQQQKSAQHGSAVAENLSLL